MLENGKKKSSFLKRKKTKVKEEGLCCKIPSRKLYYFFHFNLVVKFLSLVKTSLYLSPITCDPFRACLVNLQMHGKLEFLGNK